MHGVVAGDDIAFGQDGVAAIEIADEAASLAHQDRTRRQIPGRQIALPKSIEPPGRDPSEVEGRGAIAAQAGESALRSGDFVARQREIAAAVMRQPAGDDGFREALPRRNADALIVKERALAALGENMSSLAGL